MINEAFWGTLLLRRGVGHAGALSLGLGLAFAFNFISSLVNVGESDFWNLSSMGLAPLVLEIAGLATLMGFAMAEASVRFFRPGRRR